MPKSLKNFVPVDGFENYLVDPYGRVYSLSRKKLRVPVKSSRGYWQLHLWKDGKVFTKKFHRLVATAFIPNPENKPEVNHIYGNKQDNRAKHLEWVTAKENLEHAMAAGLRVKTLNRDEVYEIWKKLNNPVNQTAKEFGVSQSAINNIYRGRNWLDIFEEHKHLLPPVREKQTTKLSLSPDDILYIRETSGKISASKLAKLYSISSSTIRNIRNYVGAYANV
jgi:hypothetical protein